MICETIPVTVPRTLWGSIAETTPRAAGCCESWFRLEDPWKHYMTTLSRGPSESEDSLVGPTLGQAISRLNP